MTEAGFVTRLGVRDLAGRISARSAVNRARSFGDNDRSGCVVSRSQAMAVLFPAVRVRGGYDAVGAQREHEARQHGRGQCGAQRVPL
ncbi:hypothetical protein Acsp02_45040 [Actinoplanes sp. NBRC 103695]|nr:hypothetical protein Acsp02_45040 [Actinoplanes sp. NBRC 103695]